MQPRRISILGVGLLGGSIGLALRSRTKDCEITGYGHRRSTLDAALQMKAIDHGHDQLAPAVAGAELVILCTPVGLIRSLLAEIGPMLAPGAIVTDVGSTKRSIVEAAEQSLPPTVHFVGSHPMAGSEKRGVQYSRADLYEGALCIVTPAPKSDPTSVDKVESFWRLLGMKTCRLSAQEHDRRLADISHLPHALAAALVAMQDDETLALSGKGFLDVTRIAGGDGALWRDILIDNRDNVRQSINRLRQQLDKLESLLEPDQAQILQAWLDEAAQKRDGMREKNA
jgi:prephenate dehydrogenase